MNKASQKIQAIYLTLLSFNTLAASFIWGVNTLFLLDAGLTNAEAFAANAFFTAGMVLFEIPTGVIADLRGRRLSYLLGVLVLIVSTLAYVFLWQMAAPFWAWALASAFLGFGFTFFSGAVEAWLVDALNYRGFKGNFETVFAKGQVVQGAAMLVGSVAGGMIAQVSDLSIPYIVRVGFLVITFILALVFMRDLGFTPHRGKRLSQEISSLLHLSIDAGLRNPSVKWIMLAAPFSTGVMVYAFYAMQPYLLQLYGDEKAYGIAGLAAAIVAGAQIVGGLVAPWVSRRFKNRTSLLLVGTLTGAVVLLLIGFFANFWLAIGLFVLWALVFAAITPVRQAYLNSVIPSQQRATVLSFDSLLGSTGGVVIQPVLGKAADVWSYPASYILSAGFQAMALPFVWLAKRQEIAVKQITVQPSIVVPPTDKLV